jgi:hypothetical protein
MVGVDHMSFVMANNNEVLGRLFDDPDVQELTHAMKDMFPNSISTDEVIVDDNHLLEAGYIGTPPRFSLGFGRFRFFRAVVIYKDYWIRFHSRTPTTHLYSIFKEKP